MLERPAGAPATDQDGHIRPNPPSIGAYEGPSQAATAITVTNLNGAAGQTVTLRATLTSGGAGLSGKSIAFTVNGTAFGIAVTNSSGVTTKAYTISSGLSVGSHPITAFFAGDSGHATSSGSGTLTISKANTALAVAPVTGTAGSSTTLTATLTRTTNNAGISRATLTFKVDGTTVGTALTNSSGVASLSYAIPSGMVGGSHTLAVSYAGAGVYNPSTGMGTLTVTVIKSQYDADDSQPQRGSGADGNPERDANQRQRPCDWAAPSRSRSTARLLARQSPIAAGWRRRRIPSVAAFRWGTHPIAASFAGDGNYGASLAAGTLTVSKANTAIAVAPVTGSKGSTTLLIATLTRTTNNAGISGATLTFQVDGVAVGMAVTSSNGLASLPYAIPSSAASGSHMLTDFYAGGGCLQSLYRWRAADSSLSNHGNNEGQGHKEGQGQARPLHPFRRAVLLRDHAGVAASETHQMVMRSLLHQSPALQDKNHVGVADGGQAMRGQNRGAALHQPLHGFLNDALRFGFHGGGGFV